MAGIGAYPPVIRLPGDTRDESIGKGIGSLIGNIADAWNTQDAVQKSQGLAPEQQMQYLFSRLGEKGIDLVKNLTTLKVAQADIARSNAETQRSNFMADILRQQAAHEGKKEELEDKIGEATINRDNAIAAGDLSRAHSEAQNAQSRAAEVQSMVNRNKLLDDYTNVQMMVEAQKLKAMQAAQDAPGLQPIQIAPPGGRGPTVQGGPSGTTPPVQPQSFSPGQGQVAAPVRNIAAEGSPVGQTPTGASDESKSSDQSPETLLQNIETATQLIGKDKDVQKLTQPAGLTDAQIQEYNTLVTGARTLRAGGDFKGATEMEAKASELKQKASEPVSMERGQVPGAPGITWDVGRFADGSYRPMGNVKDDRKIPTAQQQSAGTGAQLWFSTADVMEKILKADPNRNLGDVLGGSLMRWVNKARMSFGLEPYGDNMQVKEAFSTIYEHNIIGIVSLLQGTRQGIQLVKMAQNTAAKPTDAPSLQREKLRATRLVASVVIKNEVENNIAEKQITPPGLLQLYKDLKLGSKDLEALKEQYVSAFRKIGAVPLDPDTGKPIEGKGLDTGQSYAPGTESRSGGGLPQGVTITPLPAEQ